MKPLIVALSLALAGVSAALAWAVRAQPAPSPGAAQAASSSARAVEESPPAPVRPLPPTVDVRAKIAQAVEQKAPALKSPRDVEHYLDDLEAQARRNRQVTALEVQPGLFAIARMRGELGPERALELELQFTQKMARLSSEYDETARATR